MNNAPNEKVNAQTLKMRYSHESSPIKTSTANSSKNLRNETAIKVKEVRRASSAAKTRTQHTTNSDCYSGDMIRIENQSFTRYKYDPNRRDKNNEDFRSTKTIKYQQSGSPAKPHIETLRTANKSHDIHSRLDKIELLMRSSELTQQKQGSKLTNCSPKATEAQTSNSPARSPKENHMEAFTRKGFEGYHTGSHDKSCDLPFSGDKGIHQESATSIPVDFDFVSFLSKDFQEKKNQFIMELARRKMQNSATLQKASPSQNKITDMSNFLRTQETPSSTKNKMKGNETENKTETLDTDYSEHAKHGNHQQSEKLRKEFYTLDDSQSNCSPMMRYSTDCEPSCNSFGELKLLKNQRLSPEEKISRSSPSQQNSLTNELSNLMDVQFSWLMDKIIVLTQEKEALQWVRNFIYFICRADSNNYSEQTNRTKGYGSLKECFSALNPNLMRIWQSVRAKNYKIEKCSSTIAGKSLRVYMCDL